MSIKLIAADLDGTLLNEKGEVSAQTQKVLPRPAALRHDPGSAAHGYVCAELLYCAERCADRKL